RATARDAHAGDVDGLACIVCEAKRMGYRRAPRHRAEILAQIVKHRVGPRPRRSRRRDSKTCQQNQGVAQHDDLILPPAILPWSPESGPCSARTRELVATSRGNYSHRRTQMSNQARTKYFTAAHQWHPHADFPAFSLHSPDNGPFYSCTCAAVQGHLNAVSIGTIGKACYRWLCARTATTTRAAPAERSA